LFCGTRAVVLFLMVYSINIASPKFMAYKMKNFDERKEKSEE